MKILVIGGGGREHAIAWKLAQTPGVELIASPGNPGIGTLATCAPAPSSVEGYCDLAEMFHVELTVVGPEAPLVAGVVDHFRARGLRIIGPTRAAAALEGSKIFAKQFFQRAAIPTAASVQVSSVEQGWAALSRFSLPVVIKADGLAAGKGVVIAETAEEARTAVQNLGPLLVIEEFLAGEEVSFMGISDGTTLVAFAPSQDHKRLLNGDQGPNTGGMGAYCDSRILTSHQSGTIMERVMLPAVSQMRREGMPFTGFLYAGLMMTSQGPKILEFNVRLGDPEAEAILHAFEGDFVDFLQTSGHAGSPAPSADTAERPSATVVLASQGYPAHPHTRYPITGISEAESTGAVVFQAGTTQSEDGRLMTAGGRVLAVTASGPSLQHALQSVYTAVDKIHFCGMQFRTDIGQKGLRRW